eukprot:TRINITY_DN2000_c1_g1_i4.p1 TRINITY_DN2000_c1_g1~~TRINITY_DN2000_c1_g1_i4.p1  ORF type:complete len:644 (-),score=64.77 TRINITY_DN2000_c1_g1_i4:449-2380(-)
MQQRYNVKNWLKQFVVKRISSEVSSEQWINPERLTAEKRRWQQRQVEDQTRWPEHVFENFVIVGLPPTVDITEIATEVTTLQEGQDEVKIDAHDGPQPCYDAEVLYKFPPNKDLIMNATNMAQFCFPYGVTPNMIQRTPSMSGLNEVIFSQPNAMRDKQAFVFMFQSGDDLPVYGICCYAEEMLHRPPPLAKEAFPECTAPVSRYRLTAPRCYCLISKYPFFEWHFKVLGMIMSVQRLEHIENFMQELTLLPQIETVHSAPGLSEQSNAVHRRALSSPTANASNQNAQHMMRSDSVSSTMGMQAESFVDATEVLENIDQEGASSSARVGAEATNHHQDEEDEVLKLLKAVYKVQVPPPGGVLRFEPENGLQHISYIRADARSKTEGGVLKVATAEAAQSLRYWTVAALCRALSVESILLLLTSVMLEKQIVVFCPSIGILSAVILSVIPLIYPLQWHSFVLPVLPIGMMDFLDAPVPFLVGMQYKREEIRSKSGFLTRVNVYKDKVSCSQYIPHLPGRKALMAELEPIHSTIRCVGGDGGGGGEKQPLYNVSDEGKVLVDRFIRVINKYLMNYFATLPQHTITDTTSGERVSLLLTDSYINSFPLKDRHFAADFVGTQMFQGYSDFLIQDWKKQQPERKLSEK